MKKTFIRHGCTNKKGVKKFNNHEKLLFTKIDIG
jgi:hypothetical protein